MAQHITPLSYHVSSSMPAGPVCVRTVNFVALLSCIFRLLLRIIVTRLMDTLLRLIARGISCLLMLWSWSQQSYTPPSSSPSPKPPVQTTRGVSFKKCVNSCRQFGDWLHRTEQICHIDFVLKGNIAKGPKWATGLQEQANNYTKYIEVCMHSCMQPSSTGHFFIFSQAWRIKCISCAIN